MTVYLNGKFLPLEDAKISVLDRGFIYGDGVYELVPVYHRQPYRLPQHLARLQCSLDGIRLANPHRDILRRPWTDSRNRGQLLLKFLRVHRRIERDLSQRGRRG